MNLGSFRTILVEGSLREASLEELDYLWKAILQVYILELCTTTASNIVHVEFADPPHLPTPSRPSKTVPKTSNRSEKGEGTFRILASVLLFCSPLLYCFVTLIGLREAEVGKSVARLPLCRHVVVL
jgi:hypothetical protein